MEQSARGIISGIEILANSLSNYANTEGFEQQAFQKFADVEELSRCEKSLSEMLRKMQEECGEDI